MKQKAAQIEMRVLQFANLRPKESQYFLRTANSVAGVRHNLESCNKGQALTFITTVFSVDPFPKVSSPVA